MTPAEWTTYLHEHIPLTRAMGVQVNDANWNHASLRMPLTDNLNHRESVFGGSISAAGILVCWLQLNLRLRDMMKHPRIVVQSSQTEYLKPLLEDFEAVCHPIEENAWKKFLETLDRKGKARITLDSAIRCEGVVGAIQHGEFVAIMTH